MQIEQLLLMIPAILVTVSLYSYVKAYVATRLGDASAKRRLTYDPRVHLDVLGAVMLLLYQYGWARQEMVQARYFENERRGKILVAIAGPLANLTFAWVVWVFLRFFPGLIPFSFLRAFLFLLVHLNLRFAVLNLLPLPPFDGAQILVEFLHPKTAYSYRRIADYGQVIMVFALIFGIAQLLLEPVVSVFGWLLLLLGGS